MQDITFSALDPSQKNAFRAIDNEKTNLHIVHGPPGTGKSQLVVSLLERLASEDKKVLFVSQNTEALRVIERMVEKTERTIGYPNDNKYVSLLDFCLLLHNPTHRYLKHLREQYTRISGKSLPHIGDVDKPDSINYSLKYTNLNHNENYATQDKEIGFDELVSYYLRYCNQTMAPEPIRNFEQVDVRTIFNTLDTYAHRDYFSEFNKPRRELILLSTKNSDLSLPEIRNKLRVIRDATKGSWTNGFAAKRTMDVAEYVATMKEYITAIEMLDIYKIGTEKKSIGDLASDIKNSIDKSEQVERQILQLELLISEMNANIVATISGVTPNSHPIKLTSMSVLVAERDINELLKDRHRLIELTKQIMTKYPNVVHASIHDVWAGIGHSIADSYTKAVDDESGLMANLTAADIIELNNETDKYLSQKGVKKLLSGIPQIHKSLLGFTSSRDIDTYIGVLRPILDSLKPVLEISDNNIESILGISQIKSSVPLGRLNISLPNDLNDLCDMFLPIHELTLLLRKYGISNENFTQTKAELTEFISSTTTLCSVIDNSDNRGAYINNSLSVFIDAINTSIDIAKNSAHHAELKSELKEIQEKSYHQNGQYLAGISEASEYLERLEEVHEYLIHKGKSLQCLIDDITLPDDNRAIHADLEDLEAAIIAADASKSFSDFFFKINSGQTLNLWLSSVLILETYNNDSEVVEFIEHNKKMSKIQTALGVENFKYLQEILSDDISFEIFAARLVNVLVGESFGRARMLDKKRVSTKDIVDAYEAFLKNQKANTYRENLRRIYDGTFAATKELSKQSTLQAGGKSNMDKFRHNTNIIIEAFPIICATPKDVSKYLAADKAIFDYVIFDEASQLLPGQAIPAMYRAKKAVIIGDPHQMPPSLNASFTLAEQSEDEFDDLGESILDLALKQPQRQHHLKVHYRSKYNKLFEPSREAIYSTDGIEPIFEAELANGAPIDIIDDLGEATDEYGFDRNFYKICESLQQYKQKDNKADFCVLFTRGDVLSKFKDFIADVGDREFKDISELYTKDKILLSTVTNCQGIEGAYTIIYMHHYALPGAMWFFKESAGAYKRLNVSITRQRDGLKLLLADPRSHWVRACDEKINRQGTGPNALQSAILMKSLLTNAGEQADTTYLDRKLGHNTEWFDSPLTERLYNRLTEYYSEKIGNELKIYSEVGWNLLIPTGKGIDANERNVGFRIDLGIYSISQKKFVLGIEMDGAMYHSGFDKEHSDYNRQKVLEDKGWSLYRIWSTNWLNDSEREFSRLVHKIDNVLN